MSKNRNRVCGVRGDFSAKPALLGFVGGPSIISLFFVFLMYFFSKE